MGKNAKFVQWELAVGPAANGVADVTFSGDWFISDWFISDWFISDWLTGDWLTGGWLTGDG